VKAVNRGLAGLILIGLVLALTTCAPPWRGPPDYESIFDKNRLVEWDIAISNENWFKLIVDPKEYVEADLTVDGVLYPAVGLRLMGTKRKLKRNMRIRFNEFVADQRFFGVKRINLRNNDDDPTQVREALALELFERAQLPASLSSYVWVTKNGMDGSVYTLVEQVDKKFLERNFGEDWGNLYKIERGGDLVYQGDAITDYPFVFASRYEKKTNEIQSDYADLISLMKMLALKDPLEFEEGISTIIDVEQVLRALALNTWLANMDAYSGTVDNLFLYYAAGGRFKYNPWDLNRAFGNYHGVSCNLTTDELLALSPDQFTCDGTRPLVTRLLSVEAFIQIYDSQLGELVDGPLHPGAVFAEIERMRQLIKDRVAEDELTEFSFDEFESSFSADLPAGDNPVRIPGLNPFVLARDSVIREYIE